MCGRYYVDDETSREIEKIVRKLDQRLKIEHGQDIHPSESAVILTKECKEVAARQMQWGFPGLGVLLIKRTGLLKPLFLQYSPLSSGLDDAKSVQEYLYFVQKTHLLAGC